MRSIKFSETAFKDFEFWLKKQPKTAQKVFQILKECRKMPFKGIGKPEPLKHNLKGFWSRRIDKGNRLVYQVEETEIIVISCKGHYES